MSVTSASNSSRVFGSAGSNLERDEADRKQSVESECRRIRARKQIPQRLNFGDDNGLTQKRQRVAKGPCRNSLTGCLPPVRSLRPDRGAASRRNKLRGHFP
jgi:hypothetical protein